MILENEFRRLFFHRSDVARTRSGPPLGHVTPNSGRLIAEQRSLAASPPPPDTDVESGETAPTGPSGVPAPELVVNPEVEPPVDLAQNPPSVPLADPAAQSQAPSVNPAVQINVNPAPPSDASSINPIPRAGSSVSRGSADSPMSASSSSVSTPSTSRGKKRSQKSKSPVQKRRRIRTPDPGLFRYLLWFHYALI